ncbi:MAG TPA: hypothetical protein VK846_17585, partial [Candidatus Limnocylindria bacterium]|nr:hypothetical protein [Candidatus Limnocylindria bacterium]
DVQRLRAEISQLRADAQELAVLRGQNQQLREDLKTQTAVPPKPEEDFFAVVQGRKMKIRCVNHLKQLGLAARIWAKDTKSDVLPDLTILKAYLPNTQFGEKALTCPEDETMVYEILSPGVSEGLPDTVYSRCPIHNTCGLTDGSVQMVDPKSVQVVKRDGWWVLRRIGE